MVSLGQQGRYPGRAVFMSGARALMTAAVALAIAAVPAAASAATPAAIPAVAGALAGNVLSITCYRPNACTGLAERITTSSDTYYLQAWNGAAWGSKVGAIAGNQYFDLNAIWCSSATHCLAVGSTRSTPTPLAETWNGTSWSANRPGLPSGSSANGAWLSGVSCGSPTFCVAVGDYTKLVSGEGALDEGLMETWNGKTWTITRKLRPKNKIVGGPAQSYLDEVSCRSARSCVAVGGSSAPNLGPPVGPKTDVAVTLVLTGRTWRRVDAPAPKGEYGQLYSVSCWAAGGCMAVGYALKNPGVTSFADRWNGRAWTVTKPPAAGVGGLASSLGDVSCLSAKFCLTVGTRNPNSHAGSISTRAIAATWNGSNWKAVSVAVPADGSGNQHGDEFFAVTCSTRTDCVALGSAGPYEGTQVIPRYLFAEIWKGKSLTLISDS